MPALVACALAGARAAAALPRRAGGKALRERKKPASPEAPKGAIKKRAETRH